MIKTDKTGTQVHGSVIDTLQEFSNIISAVRASLSSRIPEENADKLIALCARLAYSKNKDEAHEVVKMMGDVLDAKTDVEVK